MTLNEFCSNATEFGALSVSAGQVGISWAIDEPALRLHFYLPEEHAALAVRAPTRQRFGTRLIETL